ncbi:hypothetical protein [Dyella sp. ASV21]|uniref:hypothetical protein n=1 Tax=Dyella sp. ASV21 TaxID=2795114 RepID=UPI0018EA8AA0|nr:hypothetical protein [Dyella sp. ASV21]
MCIRDSLRKLFPDLKLDILENAARFSPPGEAVRVVDAATISAASVQSRLSLSVP